jgi:hypothetical protein
MATSFRRIIDRAVKDKKGNLTVAPGSSAGRHGRSL